MLQQILFRNRRIQLPQQFRVRHDRSPPWAASQHLPTHAPLKIVSRIVPKFPEVCFIL
jgi:hypothetical protein